MRKIYKSMLLLCKEQKGAVKILVGLSMFMIIGFAALVVDAGSLYFEKSSLQKSLDAAVLGGGQLLKVSEAEVKAKAKAVAIELASENGFPVSEDDVKIIITPEETSIEINKSVDKNLFFARLLGFQSTDVGATAKAEIYGSLMKSDGAIPVAIVQGVYTKGSEYTLNSTEGTKGNYGYLSLDGKGADKFSDAIMTGTKREVLEEYEWTEPGVMAGPVKKAFEWRILQDAEKSHCGNYETADNSCSRVVIVPVVETFEGTEGKSMVRITGFAAFWISEVKGEGKHIEVVGNFIEMVTGGTFGQGDDGYGIYGIKLTN